jgi:hypothetical protein
MNRICLQLITFFSLVCATDLLNAMNSNADDESFSKGYTRSSNKFFGKSDNYPGKFPEPFENKSKTIKYSTPAAQGMRRNDIRPEDVEDIIKKFTLENFEGRKDVCHNHICVVFKRKSPISKIEVSSVWVE